MRPNRTLGQNFLKSKRPLSQIIRASKIVPGEKVLEVGPGKGVLTEALLSAEANVIAVEKDNNLALLLQAKFAKEIASGQLKLIAGDILKMNPEELSLQSEKDNPQEKYKVAANIPYYITGQFLRNFLSNKLQPSVMVILLQKEVVERIIARDGKESILSISVKVYGEPKKIAIVKRVEFSPAPNVDSAIIAIENISKKFFDNISEERFFEVVRAGFAHKRKKLIRNLESLNIFGKDKKSAKEKLERIFREEKISPGIRAEDLKLEGWRALAEKIN